MDLMLLGAIVMASLTAALFFLRFWKHTRDRFFLYFAMSFGIEGVNRAVLALTGNPNEDRPFFYLVRLFSFVLIVLAIAEKNYPKRSRP